MAVKHGESVQSVYMFTYKGCIFELRRNFVFISLYIYATEFFFNLQTTEATPINSTFVYIFYRIQYNISESQPAFMYFLCVALFA